MQCKKDEGKSLKIKRLSVDERKGTTLMSCGVAKLHAGGREGGWERCSHVRYRDQEPVWCCTCVSWIQKLKQECIAPQRQAALGSSWDASRI